MSTVAGQSARVEVQGHRTLPRLLLTWELPAGAGGLGDGAVTLEVSIDGESFSATLRAADRRLELARRQAGVVEFDAQRRLWHAAAPGILTACWREPEDGRPPAAMLYARTPLIERLALPGGTYELRSVTPL